MGVVRTVEREGAIWFLVKDKVIMYMSPKGHMLFPQDIVADGVIPPVPP